jgi:hypothetical protein
MNQPNFLIGRGELLTHDISGPKRNFVKKEVYTLEQARERLAPQFAQAAAALDALVADACPDDFAVARLMMNPSFIARSYFPTGFFRAVGFESIGSRSVKVRPEAWNKKGPTQKCSTTELFVAGKRAAFRHLFDWVQALDANADGADDLTHIEQFAAFAPLERLAPYGETNERFFEVGVHLLPDEESTHLQRAFTAFAQSLNIKAHVNLEFMVGNLWFVPVEGTPSAMQALANFVFVRIIRPVPKLRGLRPVQRSSALSIGCHLPAEQALSTEPRVAILDGGLGSGES